MSFLSWIEGEVPIVESWVVARLHAFINGVEVDIADLQKAADWIFQHITVIESDLGTIASIAAAAGFAANPAIATAITVTQSALSALTAYETAHNAGASTLNSVVQAYQSLKSAQTNMNTVSTTLISSPIAK